MFENRCERGWRHAGKCCISQSEPNIISTNGYANETVKRKQQGTKMTKRTENVLNDASFVSEASAFNAAALSGNSVLPSPITLTFNVCNAHKSTQRQQNNKDNNSNKQRQTQSLRKNAEQQQQKETIKHTVKPVACAASAVNKSDSACGSVLRLVVASSSGCSFSNTNSDNCVRETPLMTHTTHKHARV